jgi:hypothetical protein
VNVIVSPHLYSSGFLSVTPLIQGLFTAAKQQAVAAMTQENATALFIPQFLQPTPFRYFTRYNTTVDERFSERDIPNSPEATDFFAVSRFSNSTFASAGSPFRVTLTVSDGDAARRKASTTPSFDSES